MRHRASRTQAEITSLIDSRCQRTEFKAIRAAGNGEGNPRKEETTEREPQNLHMNLAQTLG